MAESIWQNTETMPRREPLREDIEADVAVIGGGLAGILTAYRLQKAGITPVVLEARRTGSGQTKGTTAKITAQHGLIYARLIKQFGEEKARQYADANLRAIREYQHIIAENGISCGFQEASAFLYSTEDAKQLEEEYEAARKLGIDASLTQKTELPFPVLTALRYENQAQFHPLKFLAAIADGMKIYENTPVRAVEGDTVLTDGGSVRAGKIVFACHYPFINLPGYYFMRMHQERSYVIALKNAPKLQGMYLGIDENGLSFRSYGDTLLLGGGSHRTGEHSGGGSYQKLQEAAVKYWPDSQETAFWSAQDCMPLDGVPYIGQFSSLTPDWYIATGFQKWGMTSSMAAASILTNLIMGKKQPDAAVFSPLRFTPSASAKELMNEVAHATKGLARELFAPSQEEIGALPAGRGGIVEVNGEKMGVYKDDQGEVFIISARCPHLGCQLEWNPDEKSWDCPCHGSRFDYRGNLIDNPAQESLTHV